eukprot:UN14550
MVVDQKELMEIIGNLDQDKDGDVDWDEFVELMNEDLGFILSDKDINRAFSEADTDGDGILDAKDLHAFMKLLGEEITMKDAEGMIQTADTKS